MTGCGAGRVVWVFRHGRSLGCVTVCMSVCGERAGPGMVGKCSANPNDVAEVEVV